MHETHEADQIQLTPETIKALAHPLRLAMLGLLRSGGPSTSSDLARALDTSSGATSYHLRQLERGGFVEDAPDLGTARQRFWRAAHESTWVDRSRMSGDAEAVSLVDELSSLHSRWREAEVAMWIGSQEAWGDEWTDASADDDYELELNPSELRELVNDIRALVRERRHSQGTTSSEAIRVHLVAYPMKDGGAAVRSMMAGGEL